MTDYDLTKGHIVFRREDLRPTVAVNAVAGMPDNDNVVVPTEGGSMRIYVFTSKSRENLRAFTNDMSGDNLPQQFAPWQPNGPIAPGEEKPFRFARDQIEKAIDESGFQLWRLKSKNEEEKPTDAKSLV